MGAGENSPISGPTMMEGVTAFLEGASIYDVRTRGGRGTGKGKMKYERLCEYYDINQYCESGQG